MSDIKARNEASLWRVYLYALLIAAAVLLFCSKSSFAYPINDWSDANIYFSAGKGMLNGRVMYRDLYDHKGPLLYALHALCALAFPMDFTGVWIMECLFAAAFLTVAYRLLCLYGGRSAAPLALPVLALLAYSSYSFQLGDSAEELCLPLTLFSLYDLLRCLKKGERMSRARLMLNGFLFGCVFWTKFTLCGVHAAVFIVLFCARAGHGDWKAAFAAAGWAALGFVLSTLPWLIYFGLNGAILPWLKTYLYDNLFLYSSGGEASGLLARGKDAAAAAWAWVTENPLYAVPTLCGLGWLLLRKGSAKWERLLWGLSFALCALGAFAAGPTYPYYALALAAFAPAMLLWPCRQLAAALKKPRLRAGLTAALFVLCVGLCPLMSENVSASFGQKRESTMQYQLAAVISQYPNATLLNYGFMDAGFYTAAGIAPNVKYYHQTNVPLQEMLDEQVRYIQDGVCDFVVTRGKQPECIHDRYELAAMADSPEGYWYEHVYLYRRKDAEASHGA